VSGSVLYVQSFDSSTACSATALSLIFLGSYFEGAATAGSDDYIYAPGCGPLFGL